MQVRKAFAALRLPIVATAISFALLSSSHEAHAASGELASGTSTQTALSALEEKLYEHNYPKENDELRLNRIEKFVYGSPQTGSVNARVQRLQASLNNEANAIDKVSTNSGASASSTKSSTTSSTTSSGTTTSKSPASNATASDAVTSSPAFDSANYPRVTELETDMLNATYVHEPLAQRLSRLEAKAFGSPSKSSDLCERVDNLDEYAETHKIFKNHHDPLNSSTIAHASRPGVFSNSFLGSKSFSAPDTDTDSEDEADPVTEKKAPINPFVNGVTGTDQRLSSIEEFVYGHNYATRSAQDRLERLEKRFVPYEHNLAQKDVTYRVNNIWNILNVANTLNTAPTAAHPVNTQAIASASTAAQTPGGAQTISAPSQATMNKANDAHHSWLHQLGKSLGSANVSSNSSNVPGIYPPDMGPKPGHLWVP